MPLVSFVVPVYNAAITLNDCVKSLLTQSFADLEVIVVDDGSKDDSLKVANRIAASDSRVRVFHQENAGVSVARNRGVEEASGVYVSFVDADDWIESNACEIFSDNLKYYNYDLFCFSAVFHKGYKKTISKLFDDDISLLNESQREELHLKMMTPWAQNFEYNVNSRLAGMSWGKFYKTEILKNQCTSFKPGIKISEDTLFLILNFEKFNKIGYTTKTFYHYLFGENSAANGFRPDSEYQFSSIVTIINEWLYEKKLGARYRECANTLFIHYVFGILREYVFHKKNKKRLYEKMLSLDRILLSDPFSNALKNANRKYFSVSEWILVLLLKNKMYRIIALAMKFV